MATILDLLPGAALGAAAGKAYAGASKTSKKATLSDKSGQKKVSGKMFPGTTGAQKPAPNIETSVQRSWQEITDINKSIAEAFDNITKAI